MKSALFLEQAEEDAIEATRYYADLSVSLGDRFRDSVEAAVGRIEQHPNSGQRLSPNTRRVLLEGFPYSLVYASQGEQLLIVAVAHQSRRPFFWAKRVRKVRGA